MDQSAIQAAIASMVAAVNEGRFDDVAASFVGDATIIEDIAPFRWRGPSAVSDWLAAMGTNAATLGVEAVRMDLGNAKRIDVKGDRCYALFDGVLRLSTKQRELTAAGALTLTLDRREHDWLIDTLVWSGPDPA